MRDVTIKINGEVIEHKKKTARVKCVNRIAKHNINEFIAENTYNKQKV